MEIFKCDFKLIEISFYIYISVHHLPLYRICRKFLNKPKTCQVRRSIANWVQTSIGDLISSNFWTKSLISNYDLKESFLIFGHYIRCCNTPNFFFKEQFYYLILIIIEHIRLCVILTINIHKLYIYIYISILYYSLSPYSNIDAK